MPKYVVDTNLYIRATRSDVASRELETFVVTFAPEIYLHSVVALELLAGALAHGLEQRTDERFVRPFERRDRVITPSHRAWKRAATTVVALVRAKRLSPNGIKPSFVHDCLIAASAREHGFVLVTDNISDFELIRSVLPVDVVPPWPEPAAR
ncbi:MAG: type II toxin-antitoxin system VapC family toxin [Gemmatimonadaceae bacterium]